MKIGIVGAGIVGRLLAWHLCQQDCEVHLFCRGSLEGEDACSFIAAGMISPFSEQEFLQSEWHHLGEKALAWWPRILATLPDKVFYQDNGSLILASSRQKSYLNHYIDKIWRQLNIKVPVLTEKEIVSFEPELTNFIGCYLPQEARIDPQQLFAALNIFLINEGVVYHPFHEVEFISAKRIKANQAEFIFDKTIDCRGLGAKTMLPTLRGVRGELIYCQALNVNIQHQIRLLHPRYPCYIVPRENHTYVIGATQIESESNAPMTIESALALMTAAVGVHPGFHEANITALHARSRPTMPNHFPYCAEVEGIMHINGMFRHGYLLGPILAEQVARKILENE
ncbi:MAG: hypothetical protein BGO43_06590 [Gammaproteobacteria bacterium 39-13]|nr:FAD-dependent oxidoreductase [Gammaproteobacteria bacterium]OJV90511.1 MAG: hypothetical protein BGO43_06590 [Gammaproteobacteria bacterium 39-13]